MRIMGAVVVALLVAAPLAAQECELTRSGRLLGTVAAPAAAAGADRSAQTSIGPAPYLVLTIANSLDLATTLHALHSGRGKEGNPVMGAMGTPGLVVMKTGGAVFVGWAMKKIAHDGHPRVARTLGYVMGAAMVGVSLHNVRVGR
jgi:hypothetical protein